MNNFDWLKDTQVGREFDDHHKQVHELSEWLSPLMVMDLTSAMHRVVENAKKRKYAQQVA